MADASLDDFFAKKDKSKKKSKSSKVTTGDVIAKTDELAKKKKLKKDKEKQQSSSDPASQTDADGKIVNPEEVWVTCKPLLMCLSHADLSFCFSLSVSVFAFALSLSHLCYFLFPYMCFDTIWLIKHYHERLSVFLQYF